jgi:TolB-like protein/class 3 adenylate cyclase
VCAVSLKQQRLPNVVMRSITRISAPGSSSFAVDAYLLSTRREGIIKVCKRVNAQDTSAEPKPDLPLEIAHVLLIDVVGYSRLLVNEQIELLQDLNQIVRNTECFRAAETKGKLIRVSTGDGMALLFFHSPEEPVRCALEISRTLQEHPHIHLRMGVHSGPVNQVTDVNDKTNIAGSGINVAQRVLDCGDAGHILLSGHIAEDLAQYRQWQPYLHDLGECEVKHGLRLHLVNLYKDNLGNPHVPNKLKRGRRWKQTHGVSVRPVITPRWPKYVLTAVLLLSAVALAISLSVFYRRGSPAVARSSSGKAADVGLPIAEKSIAVLPFENRSEEKANAYFAEGIQDEILTRLSKIADLKVISRTSTQHYKSAPENLREIARELGVAHILEGSVQKSGDAVRVNVQLINAATDSHVWADTFDRKLTDIFSVESEVSQKIAAALQANLSPNESHVLAAVRTPDTEAYDLFLRGEYEFRQAQSNESAETYDRADAFYRQALARDPNFAEAAAALARGRLTRHWFVSPLEPAELEEVKSLIDRALALAPNSPQAHLALGLFFYWGHRQYQMALTEFNRTLELQPNSALARTYCAWVYRRRGEWERSLAEFQRAQELDPRDVQIPQNIGATYLTLRQWKDAERAELRALAIDPHNGWSALSLLISHLNATGDVGSARRALDGFPEATKSLTLVSRRGPSGIGDVAPMIGMWVYLDVMERRFTDAFQAFDKEVVNKDPGRLQQLAGRAALRLLAGESDMAKSAGEEALPSLEARLRERPDDTFAMTELSWVYLALRRNADALRLSRQAADTISIEKDAFSGPNFQIGLAQIEARVGAPEEAIKRLRRLLSIPAGWEVSIARLKIDPVWDPIRNRPDFQKLLSGPEQIGPNK